MEITRIHNPFDDDFGEILNDLFPDPKKAVEKAFAAEMVTRSNTILKQLIILKMMEIRCSMSNQSICLFVVDLYS